VYPQNPTDVSLLRGASKSVDAAYFAKKLQIICLLAAHHTVYKSDLEEAWEEELVERAEQSAFADLPAVAVYLHCYQMLRKPSEELHFQQFKSILLGQAERFSDEELHGLFILAINYCVRRLNAGGAQYYREALDLYKVGLAQNHLLEEGTLSRFTYHNIVAIALHVGELEWVRYFINEYKNRLERRYRESVFSFNLARLAYAERKHEHVLELLQKANYRDPLHNLAAKTLLLKTYFDLNELDSLQSLLDAMRNYIQRKRVLGYHRTNYLNIIRYTEKLLKLAPNDRAALASLRESLEKEEVLTEKAFFLNRMKLG
jgi:tetratricopeptide (TPR) repeat protein